MALLRAALLAPALAAGAYQCSSSLHLGSVTAATSKGFAVDDDTFSSCADKIPSVWPNSDTPVTSLRLFKAWSAAWDSSRRDAAWDAVAAFAQGNNAKILLGTQISCNETDDDADWAQAKQLLTKLGPQHVMGVAIGNEMELFYKYNITTECLNNIWAGGYYLRKTKARIADLDAMPGFAGIKVTSVFGAYALAGEGSKPFVDTPQSAVNTYLTQIHQLYGRRWAHTFNIYAYFDTGNHLDPGSQDQCTKALAMSTCLGDKCLPSYIGIAARTKIQQLTGNPDDDFWFGETGWSTPMADSLPAANPEMAKCAAWSTVETFTAYYKNFLQWDLAMDGTHKGPTHVFHFTIRDSSAFGQTEHFGLVNTCADTQCKLQGSGEATIVF